MESLPDRTHRVMSFAREAVVPLAELVRLLRADGCAVTEWILVRSLENDARFRILRPMRGPLADLADPDRPAAVPRRSNAGPTLVVLCGLRPAVAAMAYRRPIREFTALIRRNLARLAPADQTSPLERIRWLRMLTEVTHESHA